MRLTYEQMRLNMGQLNVRAATLKPSENLSYERARDFVVQPTWSS
jgi:hypothetical protein